MDSDPSTHIQARPSSGKRQADLWRSVVSQTQHTHAHTCPEGREEEREGKGKEKRVLLVVRRTLGRVVWERLLVEGNFYIRGNRTKWWSLMCFSLHFKCSFKDGRLEAGEMAQWARILLYKHGDLGSNPSTRKIPGVATQSSSQHHGVETGSLGLADCLLAPDKHLTSSSGFPSHYPHIHIRTHVNE